MERLDGPVFSVFEQFRTFWGEVESLREAVVARGLTPVAEPEPTALAHTPTSVREMLLACLERQDAEISRWGKGPVLELYRQVEYVMVAVADEIFVNWAWSGAAYWSANLLETARFGTRRAGDAIFARIERLIAEPHPAHKELAAVYLAALGLGFQGRYAGRSDRGAIDRYKYGLHKLVFDRAPDLTDSFRQLMPECYESTLAIGTGRRLGSPRIWWWAAAAAVAIWLIVSQAMWMRLTAPLYTHIDSIIERSAALDRAQ